MPTGYTTKLMKTGQTFPEFALLCVRAFGVAVMMRDDPMDKPIPKFEPNDWNKKRLVEAKAELARLEEMGGSERIAFGEQKRSETIAHRKGFSAGEKAENARLIAMREQVAQWQPPSPDYDKLKTFMLEQIKNSLHIEVGGGERYLREAEEKAPVHYYADVVLQAQHDIEYHTKAYAEEVEITESRNQWIEELRSSLAAYHAEI